MPADAATAPFPLSSAARVEILRARAEELARPLPREDAAAQGLEVLVFSLARSQYALATTSVREVQRLQSLTPLPGAPLYVLGMVNVRGQILAVLDLRLLLDQSARDLADLGQLIVLHHQGFECCILADTIAGTRVIATDGLHPPPPGTHGIRGITAEGFMLLDDEALWSDPRLREDPEAPP